MADFYLDFEKPIAELRTKLRELAEISANTPSTAMTDCIKLLEKQLEETIKDTYANLNRWQRVQLARHPERPYALDYIERIFTDFTEFHGDRRFADDKAMIGGFALLDKYPVMVIGTQKGRDMKSNLFRNFGWPSPEGYRKALRLMQMADRAGVPVITLIDTPGAYPGVSSEERHIGEAIAVNLREMFALKVPVVAVVIGEGGSGGALGISVGNRILLMENAYYSVITPEGCAAILWKNRAFAPKAAEALKLTAKDLQKLDIADDIVPEPLGGAHLDYDVTARNLKTALKKHLAGLRKLSAKTLKDQRYAKFRQMGLVAEGMMPTGDTAAAIRE
ncbi:Acetyl-coenzyme A carboxylase carboxyl transferase subunit alpha [bioreactor metagenome]|uniref:acetyl-CoA carboxytransferase n=1 Tax=bioreactor metagenome TaxID=1076179 RepID=A0A644YA79_9ZZZZ